MVVGGGRGGGRKSEAGPLTPQSVRIRADHLPVYICIAPRYSYLSSRIILKEDEEEDWLKGEGGRWGERGGVRGWGTLIAV